jgi:hypothetical protein
MTYPILFISPGIHRRLYLLSSNKRRVAQGTSPGIAPFALRSRSGWVFFLSCTRGRIEKKPPEQYKSDENKKKQNNNR